MFHLYKNNFCKFPIQKFLFILKNNQKLTKLINLDNNMVFTTDGSVHRTGIENEKNIVNHICAALSEPQKVKSICCERFQSDFGGKITSCVHQGGTKTKADAFLISSTDEKIPISLKDHKSGTFDWLNSSRPFHEDTQANLALKSAISDAKKSCEVDGVDKNSMVPSMRKTMEEILHNRLHLFNSQEIKAILGEIYEKYPIYTMITDHATEEILLFSKNDNFLELHGFGEWEYFLKKTRAKTSAQIWRRNPETKEEINTNLRMRVVLNNGVTALMGLSKANKSSHPCLKIQQDNVDKTFIPTLQNVTREKFTPELKKFTLKINPVTKEIVSCVEKKQ